MTTQMTAPTSVSEDPWDGFERGAWTEHIDVRDFIQRNYTPYEGDASFLSGPTDKTLRLVGHTGEELPVRGAQEARTRR